MFVVVRLVIVFCVGIFGTLAWQTYGGPAREAIASWSPRLAWLAPPGGASPPDQIAAISRDLAVVRQGVDKLTADVSKLQTLRQGALDRTSTSQPSTARRRNGGPSVE